jgi:DNA-binding SARP family transcriptional activator
MSTGAATPAERMRAMRARRAASIEAVPDDGPRDPAELLFPSVEASIEALKLSARDAAAAQLARRYAAAIDDAGDPAAALRAFGPLLAKAMEALGATPAARKSAGRQPEQRRPNKIAQLRAAHQATVAKQKRGA